MITKCAPGDFREAQKNQPDAEFELSKPSKSKELKALSMTEKALTAIETRCLAMKIDGIDDKEGYITVHENRMFAQKYRLLTEEQRKTLNKPLNEEVSKNNETAKEITKRLKAAENHLRSEEKRIDDEKQAIKDQKIKEIADRLKIRVSTLLEMNADFDGLNYSIGSTNRPLTLIRDCADVDFERMLKNFQDDFKIVEATRIKKEADDKIISDKAIADKAETDRKAKIETDKLNADKKQLADDKAELQKEKDQLAKDKKVLADEKAAKVAKEAKAKAEKKRLADIEAQKPDREKLGSFIEVLKDLEYPEMETDKYKLIVNNTRDIVKSIYIGLEQ